MSFLRNTNLNKPALQGLYNILKLPAAPLNDLFGIFAMNRVQPFSDSELPQPPVPPEPAPFNPNDIFTTEWGEWADFRNRDRAKQDVSGTIPVLNDGDIVKSYACERDNVIVTQSNTAQAFVWSPEGLAVRDGLTLRTLNAFNLITPIASTFSFYVVSKVRNKIIGGENRAFNSTSIEHGVTVRSTDTVNGTSSNAGSFVFTPRNPVAQNDQLIYNLLKIESMTTLSVEGTNIPRLVHNFPGGVEDMSTTQLIVSSDGRAAQETIIVGFFLIHKAISQTELDNLNNYYGVTPL